MKALLRAASLLLLAGALLGAAAPTPDAGRIRRLLPGLWRADTVQGPLTVRATSDYRRDGTALFVGRITGPGVDLAYRVRSRWSVEGSVLVAEVVETDQPELLAVGSRTRDTVLAIDEKRLRYRDEDGGEFEELRIRAP